jgi:hypothetical protein
MMRLRAWVLGLVAAAGWITATAAAPVEAVETNRSAILTKCHSWMFSRDCHTYHHVRLPARIAIGDKVSIMYGSNTKRYEFPVLHIRIEGDQCTLFGEEPSDPDNVDKLVISSCRPAP